jgi:hypothetical protein
LAVEARVLSTKRTEQAALQLRGRVRESALVGCGGAVPLAQTCLSRKQAAERSHVGLVGHVRRLAQAILVAEQLLDQPLALADVVLNALGIPNRAEVRLRRRRYRPRLTGRRVDVRVRLARLRIDVLLSNVRRGAEGVEVEPAGPGLCWPIGRWHFRPLHAA